jgi:DNA polymerase/3'-5' exonuclease PolX
MELENDINDEHNNNKRLASLLYEIAMYYRLARDAYRAKAFNTGGDAVFHYKGDITSGNDIINVHGVGKSISDSIDEYIPTGRIKRLEELQKTYIKEKELFDYFQSFYGIGPVKAIQLIEAGYTTLSQLWDNKDKLLTYAQQQGIFWRNHINVRIPKEEMDMINEEISNIFNNKFNWIMAGSYRREEESSGDIDLLIERDDSISMDDVYELLGQYLPTTLAKGEKKLAGIFRLSNEYFGHRIDILIVEKQNWPFALLHFTGSGRFNVLMRNRAKSFGWKLSEYNLLNENNEKINVLDEKEIFDVLGVKYIPPNQRFKTLTALEFTF